MLAKQYRFHGYGSLKFVYSKGKSARTKFLSLKYIPNTRREQPRLAIVVSKKISKKAPERNRIRRRLYEAFRIEWPNIKPAQDMVVTVFDGRTGTMPAQELSALVKDLIHQADLYKTDQVKTAD